MSTVRRLQVTAQVGVVVILILLGHVLSPRALLISPFPLHLHNISTLPLQPMQTADINTRITQRYKPTSDTIPVKFVPPVHSSSNVSIDGEQVLTGEVYVAGHEIHHSELCPSLGVNLTVLILVTSRPQHFKARNAVRLTWGHYALRTDVSFAFIIGIPPVSLRSKIEAENSLYSDIIVGRFVDSYSNLTLKTLSMLEWVDTYCPQVPKLLKTDDDTFINVPRLIDFAKAPKMINATKMIWGQVASEDSPVRDSKNKYYVPPLQYPGEMLPDYTLGPSYLLTTDIIRTMLVAAPYEPYLRLEDVFITGVLRSNLGIKLQNVTNFHNRRLAHPCEIQTGIAMHKVRYEDQFDLWLKMFDGRWKCMSPTKPLADFFS